MLNQPLDVPAGLDLPEFLQADAELLGLLAAGQIEALDQLLGEMAAHALAEQGVSPAQLHPARKAFGDRAIFCNSHVPRSDADDGTLVVE